MNDARLLATTTVFTLDQAKWLLRHLSADEILSLCRDCPIDHWEMCSTVAALRIAEQWSAYRAPAEFKCLPYTHSYGGRRASKKVKKSSFSS